MAEEAIRLDPFQNIVEVSWPSGLIHGLLTVCSERSIPFFVLTPTAVARRLQPSPGPWVNINIDNYSDPEGLEPFQPEAAEEAIPLLLRDLIGPIGDKEGPFFLREDFNAVGEGTNQASGLTQSEFPEFPIFQIGANYHVNVTDILKQAPKELDLVPLIELGCFAFENHEQFGEETNELTVLWTSWKNISIKKPPETVLLAVTGAEAGYEVCDAPDGERHTPTFVRRMVTCPRVLNINGDNVGSGASLKLKYNRSSDNFSLTT